MKTHIIENGVVVNTILASMQDAANAFPSATVVNAVDGGAIGDTWDGERFISPPAPPVPVPQTVTMRQARLALHAAGLLSSVDTAIASMQEPAKTAAQIEWEYAAVVERNAGLVPAMAAALGMSEADIDDLFITAATL